MIVDVGGIKVNYVDIGDGEPLLILEGWGTNTGLYMQLAEHLAENHRVLLPDLPGFGETPEPLRPWNVSDYAVFVQDFLKTLNIGCADLIGHSHGGRVIIKTVTGKPNFTTEKIALIDSAGIVPEKKLKQRLSQRTYKTARVLLETAPVKAAFPDALEKLRSKRGSADYKNASPVMRQTLVALVNEDLRHLMPLIEQPVLLVWGDKDTATPLSDAHIMEKLIPDAGLVVVPGAGHYSYLERPEFVYRVLDSFFGG